MGRITKEHRAINQLRFDGIIFDALLDGEWHLLTYQLIADRSGVTRSTLQGYFPSEQSFITAIQGKVLPVFLGYLNFDSLHDFKESWIHSLSEEKFLNILHMLTRNMRNELSIRGINRLIEMISERWGDDGYAAIELLLGKSLLYIAGIKKRV